MTSLYWKAVLALISVLAMMFGVLFLLKGAKRYVKTNGNMNIDETLFLDNKRRLVLVRYKNTRYLLLIGGNTEILMHKEDVV